MYIALEGEAVLELHGATWGNISFLNWAFRAVEIREYNQSRLVLRNTGTVGHLRIIADWNKDSFSSGALEITCSVGTCWVNISRSNINQAEPSDLVAIPGSPATYEWFGLTQAQLKGTAGIHPADKK